MSSLGSDVFFWGFRPEPSSSMLLRLVFIVSGLGSDVFFFFFDLRLLFLFFCALFKGFGFRF